MSDKQAKKLRKSFRERINSMANQALRREIFRLARNRDVLGLAAIFEGAVIITLAILLLYHWG